MTQVNWTRNLLMAMALCALGGFAYWLEYKHNPEKQSSEEVSKKIFALKDTQIESMRLDDGKTAYQWDCLDLQAKTCKPGDNSKWKLTSPTQVRADDSNANSLVSALNNLNPSEIIDLKDETADKRASLLKEYGLSPEQLQTASVRKVDVKTDKGETVVYLGEANPINQNIFAVAERVPAGQKPTGKVNDQTVYQIPDYFKTEFTHDLTYWRDKKVLSFAASEIDSFEIKSKKNGVIQAQKKDGNWTIQTGPTAAKLTDQFDGDIENVDTFLGAAAYLTAKTFVADTKSDPKAKAALKGVPELVTITFHKKADAAPHSNESSVTLTVFGHPEGSASKSTAIYATVSNTDPLYELQSTSTKQLDREAKDFRLTKLITSLERFSIKKMEFSGKPIGTPPLTLALKDTKWVNATDQSEINNDRVQMSLDKLSGKRIQGFVSGKDIPPGEQDGLQVTFGDDQNPAKRRLVFWKNGKALYARDLNSPRKEAFIVDSSVAEALPWDRKFYELSQVRSKTN